MKLGFAFTGSFCNHEKAIDALKTLAGAGNTVIPFFSPNVKTLSTRFGSADALWEKVVSICGAEPVWDIPGAEQTVTNGGFDCVIICPCTGNTCAKIACGVTDTAVTMAAKAQLRNGGAVLLALASNDALGANLKNIGLCMDKKNVYFVPMRQDDPQKKPRSLVCDFSLTPQAAEDAARGIQIQPVFL